MPVDTGKAFLGAAFLAAGIGVMYAQRPPTHFPAQALPTLGGGEAALGDCQSSRCLTMVVAPWCPYCREALPTLLQVRDGLQERGIGVRVVVGLDSPENVRDYAQKYGPATVVDERRALHPRGVPHFYVTDNTGLIVREWAGALSTNDVGAWEKRMYSD